MTIRIHEADGTPYEHIVEIKEAVTRIDIPYNTKYKRLKRSRRHKERAATTAGAEFPGDGNDDVLLYCLGDVLQTDEELKDWKLDEWSKDDEVKMSQESYEWIRMDADFEWLCRTVIAMPDYMFQSQLQQDRDVVAQYEVSVFLSLLIKVVLIHQVDSLFRFGATQPVVLYHTCPDADGPTIFSWHSNCCCQSFSKAC